MKNNPLSDYNNRRKYWEYKDLRLQRSERMVLKALQRFFEGQKKRVLEAMPQDLKSQKDLASEVFRTDREIGLAKQAIFPILKEAMILEGMEVASRFDVTFNLTMEMESWLDTRTELMAESITNTTHEQLTLVLSEGVEAGENYTQMANRITNKYDEISTGRANVIARTETHGATQKANFEGYKQGGVEMKTWVAVMDSATRDEHAAMDGEEQPIHKPFSNGLMFPSEINCRCQI